MMTQMAESATAAEPVESTPAPRHRSQLHDNNFDLIRLLAAGQVVFIHSLDWLKLPHPGGWLLWAIGVLPGVPVFFLISGFLVTKSFIDCGGRTLDFGVRRALRIYPGLWANYLFLFGLMFIGGNLPLAKILSARFLAWIAGAFTLGSDYYGGVAAGPGFSFASGFYPHFPSGVLWTISVELGFYLLVPFVFANFVRRNRLTNLSILFWTALSLAVCTTYAAYATDLPPAMTQWMVCLPFPYFWVFLIGSAIQINWDLLRRALVGKAWIWVPVYFAASTYDRQFRNVGILNFQDPDAFIVARTIALGFATISLAFTFRRLGRVLRGVDLSYGTYLYHMPVMWTLIGFGLVGSIWLWPVVVALTASLAALSWFLVESPFLRRKTAVTGSLRRMLAAVAPGTSQPRIPTVRRGGVTLAVFVTLWIGALASAFGFHAYARGESASGARTGGVPIYAIEAVGNRNWQTAGEARAVVDGSAIRLTGDLTRYEYQLVTTDIRAVKGQDYLLEYSIEVSGGMMGIGVLDAGTGQWIKTLAAIASPQGAIRFHGAERMQVVVFNSNAVPAETTARIAALRVYPIED